jgi:glutamine amidotransferase
MKINQKLVIIDYGMGNLWSVYSAFKFLGVDVKISSDPRDVLDADLLVLPGVGSFRKAMESLERKGLVTVINEAVLVKKTKILGICLGMQLFAESGFEDGYSNGFGFIKGSVREFHPSGNSYFKLPHIGFNNVKFSSGSLLGSGLELGSDFYFVHSYRMSSDNLPGHTGICDYGETFLATYENDNLFATQFHPEKSQTNGLQLLSNFLLA